MKISRIKALITLFVVVIMVSLPVHATNTGYPNGRGWRAVQQDLNIIKRKIARIQRTLDVQVSVDIDSEASTPATGVVRVIARIFVQVNKLGSGLDTLDDASFVYSNSYAPTGGAPSYCGLSCFTALGNGLYVLEITDQDYVPGTYAATLNVQDLSKPQPPVGTALVTFTLP